MTAARIISTSNPTPTLILGDMLDSMKTLNHFLDAFGQLGCCWLMFLLVRHNYHRRCRNFFVVQSLQFCEIPILDIVVYGHLPMHWEVWKYLDQANVCLEVYAMCWCLFCIPQFFPAALLMAAHVAVKFNHWQDVGADWEFTLGQLWYLRVTLNLLIIAALILAIYSEASGNQPPEQEHVNEPSPTPAEAAG